MPCGNARAQAGDGALQGAHNFALFSSSASAVYLVLFTRADLNKGKATVEIKLDSEINRTGNIWHVAVPGIPAGYLYGAAPMCVSAYSGFSECGFSDCNAGRHTRQQPRGAGQSLCVIIAHMGTASAWPRPWPPDVRSEPRDACRVSCGGR